MLKGLNTLVGMWVNTPTKACQHQEPIIINLYLNYSGLDDLALKE